jgi:SAM-dependent methyltransferase
VFGFVLSTESELIDFRPRAATCCFTNEQVIESGRLTTTSHMAAPRELRRGNPSKTARHVRPEWLRGIAKAILPMRVRRWLRLRQKGWKLWPRAVQFGSLGRVTPISRVFGYDRGHCIDRFYIEHFLANYASDIRGRVLEVADNEYTKRFGDEQVVQSDVIHLQEGAPQATIIADLTTADQVASASFDCIILTQTLQFIYDMRAAISTLHRLLKPGGILLATFPGISQISRYDMDRWGDHWRFTTLSAKRLFEEEFRPADVMVEAYGNVFAAIALLHGLAVEDVDRRRLEYRDPDYQVVITVRAVKSDSTL